MTTTSGTTLKPPKAARLTTSPGEPLFLVKNPAGLKLLERPASCSQTVDIKQMIWATPQQRNTADARTSTPPGRARSAWGQSQTMAPPQTPVDRAVHAAASSACYPVACDHRPASPGPAFAAPNGDHAPAHDVAQCRVASPAKYALSARYPAWRPRSHSQAGPAGPAADCDKGANCADSGFVATGPVPATPSAGFAVGRQDWLPAQYRQQPPGRLFRRRRFSAPPTARASRGWWLVFRHRLALLVFRPPVGKLNRGFTTLCTQA